VRSIRTAVVALAATVSFVVASAPARALADSFSVTPTSGPAGTEVSVSGTGCSPGLTNNSSDYVMVTATNPFVSLELSVTNAGAWSGSFTIPDGTLPVVAVLAAACFTNGLPSIVTTYAPQTFTVTAPSPAPTTTPTTSGVSPSTTVPGVIPPGPGTVPHSGGTTPRPTVPGGGSNNGGGGDSTTPGTNPDGTPNDGSTDGGASRSSTNAHSPTDTDSRTTSGRNDQVAGTDAKVASAATDFTARDKNDDLTWLWWMLVVLGLFIVGALAMGLRWRYEERHESPS
jgi:hypothetical protein